MQNVTPSNNEQGYVLISTLVMLMLLTLIGISMTNTTSIELLVAGSEKIHQETFYTADGATEIASELLEQNINCAAGFSANDDGARLIENDPDNKVRVTNLIFWMEEPGGDPIPSDTNRDFFFPDVGQDTPHTNVKVQGVRGFTPGGNMAMHSGYEPLGVSVAKSGAHYKYDIYAQHIGRQNSEATIHIQWRHVGGPVGSCAY